MKTETINILKLIPSKNNLVITDKETETLRAKTVYLGKDDDKSNYMEIPEDTPLADEIEFKEILEKTSMSEKI